LIATIAEHTAPNHSSLACLSITYEGIPTVNTTQTEKIHRETPRQFVIYTVIAAVVAALAAWSSEALALEVWVMFAGFIAWFTGPTSSRGGLYSMICLGLGMALGALSYAATGAMMAPLGPLALPVAVFVVAIVVVGLRTTSVVNNVLAWFLGMVTFFAAEVEISLETVGQLGCASAIGGFAGWACQALNRRWAGE
jgi:hypothetical protein